MSIRFKLSATALVSVLCLTASAYAQTKPQALQPVSLHSPASSNYTAPASRVAQTPDLFQSGTPDVPFIIASAYDSWPSAAEQTRRLSEGALSVMFDPAQAEAGFAPLKRAQTLGLGALRLKLSVFAHTDDAGKIAPEYLEALENTVNEALDTGAIVILAEDDAVACSKLPDACVGLLSGVWAQLGERFRHAPPRLMFELLTEPRERLTADKWNVLAANLITTVRQSNPARNLLIAPATVSGTSLDGLNALSLPASDRHLILAVRFDDPMAAIAEPNRALLKIKSVNESETESLTTATAELNALSAWSRLKDRPVLLTEIGARDAAQMRYRTRWVAHVIGLAQSKGLGWGLGEGARKLEAADLKLPETGTGAVQNASNRAPDLSSRAMPDISKP